MKTQSNRPPFAIGKRIFLTVIVVLFLLLPLFVIFSCSNEQRKYVIGVSQCSKDSWREKLEDELRQATYFNEDVELIMCSADNDAQQQCRQIDSLVNLNVDLLVVSPQTQGDLGQSINKAMKKDIPVILFDRKTEDASYTAFMGADNYNIGKMMGNFAAMKLQGEGSIVEIGGEHGSSPAVERHRGFNDALKAYPGIKVVGFDEGDWKQPSGELAMERILSRLEIENPDASIDLVFGGNDRMALGARKAIERYRQSRGNNGVLGNNQIMYLGIDALPTDDGGMEKVRDGELTASAIYPTHGYELMELALKILKGEKYPKTTDMETGIVTADNARVLLIQNKEIQYQDQYINKMQAKVSIVISAMKRERFLLLVFILVAVIISTSMTVIYRAYKQKAHLYEELQQKNDELNREKETVERQRDQLEEQRDQILDVTTKPDDEAASADETAENADVAAKASSVTADAGKQKTHGEEENDIKHNEFMERLRKSVDKRIANADLSVEDIGQDLCLSRVQLYRKVKAMTGKTPVELIREERLRRAKVLLADSSLTVSEVAYRVGFSAPSYFAKCYKEYYGVSPSGK